MASRVILCKRLLSYSTTRFFPQLHSTICSVSVLNSSLNQLKVWFSYTALQHDRQIGWQLERSKVELPNTDQPVRYYAKSRDKKKSDKGQKKKVQVGEELLAEAINVNVMQEQMQGAIEKLKNDFIKNVSLRSSTGTIETLPITFEGKDYILQDLAQVVRKNPKTMIVNMTAFPQAIPTVLLAISKSGMNLNPQQDGTTLFIPIPKITKEHRESLSKNAKALFIRCRDNIKVVQNNFIKTVKTKEKGGLAQDTAVQISEYIAQVATEYISTAEKMLEAKQQELLNET